MKSFKITDFDLDNIIYWSAIKKLYPDLYNVYMNDTQDLSLKS